MNSFLFFTFYFLIQFSAAITASKFCGDDSSGWTVFKGNCYKLFSGKMDFQQAEAVCNSFGAHAASVHTVEESQLLTSMIQPDYGLCQQGYCYPHSLTMAPNIDREHVLYMAYWIGLQRTNGGPMDGSNAAAGRAMNRVTIWTDGTPFDFAKSDVQLQNAPVAHYPWHQCEPSGTNGFQSVCTPPNMNSCWAENCAAVVGLWQGQWNDCNCAHTMAGVICKKPTKCNRNAV